MEEMKVLSICKLNIYQVLTFMFKTKRDYPPGAFRNDFRKISHGYPTGFSQSNIVEGKNSVTSNKSSCLVSRFRALEFTFKSRTKKHGIY